jgi:hypothetical protein
MFFQVIHRRSSAGVAEAKISHRRYGAGLSILLALLRSAKLQPKDVASTANGGLSARPTSAGPGRFLLQFHVKLEGPCHQRWNALPVVGENARPFIETI